MSPMSYFDKTNVGVNTWKSYVISSLFILFWWRIVGGIQFLYFSFGLQQKHVTYENLTNSYQIIQETFIQYPIISYILMHIPFVIGLIATIYIIQKVHKRSFLSLITPYSLNLKLLFTSLFLITFLIGLSFGVLYWNSPQAYPINPSFDLRVWVLFLILSCVLTGVQILLEEVIFRGYLIQGFATKFKSLSLAVSVSIILFGLMHFYLPGATSNIFTMMSYFVFGAITTGLVLKHKSLESAIAFHFVLNMYFVTILSFSGSTYPTNGLILVNVEAMNGVLDSLLQILVFVLFYSVMTSPQILSYCGITNRISKINEQLTES